MASRIFRSRRRKIAIVRALLLRHVQRSKSYKLSARTEAAALKAYLGALGSGAARPGELRQDRKLAVPRYGFRYGRASHRVGSLPQVVVGGRALSQRLALASLSKLNFFQARVPVQNSKGQIIRRAGQPVTTWEISNRDMGSMLRIIGGVAGLGRPTRLDYRASRRLSPAENSGALLRSQYVRRSNSWKKPFISFLEVIEGGLKSPISGRACLRQRSSRGRQLVAWDRAGHVARSDSQRFRSNSHSLTALARLPKSRSRYVWVDPASYYGLRRLIYTTYKQSAKPLGSTVYQVVPPGFIGYRRSAIKKSYMPRWMLDKQINNLIDRAELTSGRLPKIQVVGGLKPGAVGAPAVLRSAIVKTRSPSAAARLRKLVPVVVDFRYNSRGGRVVTQNKARSFVSRLGPQSGTILRQSQLHAMRQYMHGGLGLYTRHPRWSTNLNKVFRVAPPAWLLSWALRSSYTHAHTNLKSWSRQPWLRNAGGVWQ